MDLFILYLDILCNTNIFIQYITFCLIQVHSFNVDIFIQCISMYSVPIYLFITSHFVKYKYIYSMQIYLFSADIFIQYKHIYSETSFKQTSHKVDNLFTADTTLCTSAKQTFKMTSIKQTPPRDRHCLGTTSVCYIEVSRFLSKYLFNFETRYINEI